MVTDAFEWGGAVAVGPVVVFPDGGGAVPTGAVGVTLRVGAVVVAVAGAKDDEDFVLGGTVVDEPGRVDRVVGVSAPDDAQAARSSPPATTIPSDRTMRVIRILLLAPGLAHPGARSVHR